MRSKKGQLTLEGAPAVVMIVGLVFLVMATIAFVAEKYGDSMPSDNSASIQGESVVRASIISAAGATVAGASAENAESFALVQVLNGTGGVVIQNGNFTLNSATGVLKNTSSMATFTATNFVVNYTYNYAGTAANVTTDLQTEISNNTSIAGIILTISLVGIVLTVLMGVFLGIRRNRV